MKTNSIKKIKFVIWNLIKRCIIVFLINCIIMSYYLYALSKFSIYSKAIDNPKNTRVASELIKDGELEAGTIVNINNMFFTILDTNYYVGGNEKTGLLLLSNDPAITLFEYGNSNNWKTSAARIYCKKFAWDKLYSLSSLLLNAYHKDNSSMYDNNKGVDVDLTGERCFLLSSGEFYKYRKYVTNYNVPLWAKYNPLDISYDYWLRNKQYAADDEYNNNVNYYNVSKDIIDSADSFSYKCIRPAIVVSRAIPFSKQHIKNKDYNSYIKLVVKFDTSGGSQVNTQIVDVGDKIARPIDPIKEHCIFRGWYRDKKFKVVWDFDKDQITTDITIYAKFEKIEKYTVKFETNGSDKINSQSVYNGDKIIKPVDPVKTKYTFKGWYVDKEFKEKWDFDKDLVNKNITLYACFEKNYNVIYIIYGIPDLYIKADICGGKIVKIDDPEKEGYIFDGWYYGPWYNHLKHKWDFDNDIVKNDMMLYSKFIKKEPIPDSSEPEPENSNQEHNEPINPGQVNPDPVEPEPTVPDPIEPESTGQDPIAHEPTNPNPASQVPTDTELVRPLPVDPDSISPGPSDSKLAEPLQADSDSDNSDLTGAVKDKSLKGERNSNTNKKNLIVSQHIYSTSDIIIVIILIISVGLTAYYFNKNKN